MRYRNKILILIEECKIYGVQNYEIIYINLYVYIK